MRRPGTPPRAGGGCPRESGSTGGRFPGTAAASRARHARRPDRPAGLRHRVRPSGRERCRPPRRGSHPQAAAGAGPGHRRAPGVATDAVAIRERCGPGRLVSDGTGAGRERHRAAPATPAGAGAADHDRSGPDRRPDARGATAHLLQRVLRHVVLSAAAGVRDVRPRSGAVPLCGGAAVRQGGSLRGSGGPVVAVAAAAALRVSAGAVPRSARRGLCDTGGLRLPGCLPAARLRPLDTEERRAAAARRARHDAGAGAQRAQRPNRARLRRDPLCGRLVEAAAACRDQGRGRPTRGPRAAGQSPLRGDQPVSTASVPLRESLLRAR